MKGVFMGSLCAPVRVLCVLDSLNQETAQNHQIATPRQLSPCLNLGSALNWACQSVCVCVCVRERERENVLSRFLLEITVSLLSLLALASALCCVPETP